VGSRSERFAALAEQVTGPLRAYVVRRVPADDVDDVLADVALVLWRRLDDVPADDPLPWCYGVARRQVANQHRSERRWLRLLDRIRAVDPPREAGPAVDEHADEHADVHAALAALKELDRELVRLWAWEQLEPREIAAVTGLTANAVSIRLHRARRRLAAELGRGPAEVRDLRKDSPGAGQVPGEGGTDR
jgi:RNA polymerase sigma-70 factor (ECF subfamily)